MERHFHANSAARAIGGAPRNNLFRKANSTVARLGDGKGQSPFSPLLCVLLLMAAGMLVKFGAALQSLHVFH